MDWENNEGGRKVKKRVLAFMLSVCICACTVLEVGAAVITDGQTVQEEDSVQTDSTDEGSQSEQEQEPADTSSDETEDDETVDTDEEEQEDEEEAVQETEETQEIQEDPSNELEAEEEPISTLEPQAAVYTAKAADSIVVQEKDAVWEQDAASGLYKLRRVQPQDGQPEYYVQEDGLVTVAYAQGAAGYYFDENGVLQTGEVEVPAGTRGFSNTKDTSYYFMPNDSVDYVGGAMKTSNLGRLQKNFWYYTGSAWRFFCAGDGSFMSVTEYWNRYTDGKQDWIKVKDKYFIFPNANGVPRTGVQIIPGHNNQRYYMEKESDPVYGAPGKMVQGEWRQVPGAEGTVAPRWWYFGPYGYWVKKYDKQRIPQLDGGKYYYVLSETGYLFKNTMKEAISAKSTVSKKKYWYFVDSNYRVVQNKLYTYKGKRYYINEYGHRAEYTSGWHMVKPAGNRFYKFGAGSAVVEVKNQFAIVTYNGKKAWYYFNANGNHYKNLWNIGSISHYYFLPSGVLASGVTEYNGNKYFFKKSSTKKVEGARLTGWIGSAGHYYYANPKSAILAKGWTAIDGAWHYFDPNTCAAVSNKVVTRNGVKGWLDSKGKFCTGWIVTSNANNQVKYFDSASGSFVKSKWKTINGLKYYFDANGYRRNDVSNVIKGPYALQVDRKNGVITIYTSDWKTPVKSVRTSVGAASTPTPLGDYHIYRAGRWQLLMGPSYGQYASHVSGAGQGGIFIHSVACTAPSSYALPANEFNKLGNPASHGCIRTNVADALWIYNNCNGAAISIVDKAVVANDALKGPLGKPKKITIPNSQKYDPTDPAV